MAPNRTAALFLIAGIALGLGTMAVHPTARDVVANASTGSANRTAELAHALALIGEVFLLAGMLRVTKLLYAGSWDLSLLAFLFFATSASAALVAAAASGFIAPAVVASLRTTDAAARDMTLALLRYTGIVNRTFARIEVVASAVAFFLWSVAMRRQAWPPAIAIYGATSSALLVIALGGGLLPLDVHGFGLVVVLQGVLVLVIGRHLWRLQRS
jgi:hypothetical protein